MLERDAKLARGAFGDGEWRSILAPRRVTKGGRRSKTTPLGPVDRAQPIAIDSHVRDGRKTEEPTLHDPIEATLQNGREMRRVRFIGEAADLRERANHLRREVRENARHPRGVTLRHSTERGVGIFRFPPFRIEVLRVEEPEDLVARRSLDAVPW